MYHVCFVFVKEMKGWVYLRLTGINYWLGVKGGWGSEYFEGELEIERREKEISIINVKMLIVDV